MKKSYIVWFEDENPLIVNVSYSYNEDCGALLRSWLIENYSGEPCTYVEFNAVSIIDI